MNTNKAARMAGFFYFLYFVAQITSGSLGALIAIGRWLKPRPDTENSLKRVRHGPSSAFSTHFQSQTAISIVGIVWQWP